uniref:Uncharacterized protein n=1 Tax=Aegilops tauschii TaxID=37682 RepID=R7W423_AEGTA
MSATVLHKTPATISSGGAEATEYSSQLSGSCGTWPSPGNGCPCPSPTAGGGGASRPMDGLGDAGPTPFLAKTYDMVDDPAMDAVISWTATNKSSSRPPPLRHRAVAEFH